MGEQNEVPQGQIEPKIDEQNSSIDTDVEGKKPPERKLTVAEIIAFGKEVLAGERKGDVNEEPEREPTGRTLEGSPEEDDPVVLDTKRQDYSPEEQLQILEWLATELDAPTTDFTNVPVAAVYEHVEYPIQFRVFEKIFGIPENPWQIVEYNEINEEGKAINPLYALYSPSMIADKAESGFLPLGDHEEGEETE